MHVLYTNCFDKKKQIKLFLCFRNKKRECKDSLPRETIDKRFFTFLKPNITEDAIIVFQQYHTVSKNQQEPQEHTAPVLVDKTLLGTYRE